MIDFKAREDKYVLPTYEKFPFALSKGRGCLVWDETGKEYLDLYGGHAVSALGHCPAEVVAAVAAQAGELMFYSNLVYSKVRAEAAKALVDLCGAEGAQVFFCNSGAEANENAMRLARAVTGKSKIVATVGSFHGRTAAALAATGIAKYRKGLTGLGGDVVHVPFGSHDEARRVLSEGDVAGFILEPIQSMGGAVEPPAGYLAGLEALCREAGALLIFDEVQTGLGRVGAPSAAHLYSVKPNLQTFAKALGSGVPAAAVLADAATSARVKSGALGSTFGGGPLACAAVKATLESVFQKRLWENAAAREKQIRESFKLPGLVEIRGKGLLLGLVFDAPTKAKRDALLAGGIIVGGADDPNVIRLLPPLTVTEAEIERLRKALS